MLLTLFIKYIPFWTIPLMIICAQMGWTFKKRGKKSLFKMSIVVFIFALLSLIFFIFKGSPQKSLDGIESIHDEAIEIIR